MKTMILLLAVLGVLSVSSYAVPLEDELLVFEQYRDVVSNKNIAATEEQTLKSIGDEIIRGACENILNKNMPQETERALMQSIYSTLQMMQNEEQDIAATQFLQHLDKWVKKNGKNLMQNMKLFCQNYLEPPTSFENVLIQRLFDSNTDEVASQGRRRGFWRRVKDTAKDYARKKVCGSRWQDKEALEEALAQYVDNQLEKMQSAEGEAQFWSGLKSFWNSTKRDLKPIIRDNFCASIEVMDDDDEIEDKIMQSVLQSWLEVIQKK